jgi:hypothetical protein
MFFPSLRKESMRKTWHATAMIKINESRSNKKTKVRNLVSFRIELPQTSAIQINHANNYNNVKINSVMRKSIQATLSRSFWQSPQPWLRYNPTQRRYYAAKSTLPTVELCPEPSCECRPTPEGLDIDRKSHLTKPHYDEHLIISTGTSDWSSRLNEDGDTGAAYEALRFFLNRTGRPDGSRRFGEFYNVGEHLDYQVALLTSPIAHPECPDHELLLPADDKCPQHSIHTHKQRQKLGKAA